jgi:hypothetical protein
MQNQKKQVRNFLLGVSESSPDVLAQRLCLCRLLATCMQGLVRRLTYVRLLHHREMVTTHDIELHVVLVNELSPTVVTEVSAVVK